MIREETLDFLGKVRKTLLFILPYLYEDVKTDKILYFFG